MDYGRLSWRGFIDVEADRVALRDDEGAPHDIRDLFANAEDISAVREVLTPAAHRRPSPGPRVAPAVFGRGPPRKNLQHLRHTQLSAHRGRIHLPYHQARRVAHPALRVQRTRTGSDAADAPNLHTHRDASLGRVGAPQPVSRRGPVGLPGPRGKNVLSTEREAFFYEGPRANHHPQPEALRNERGGSSHHREARGLAGASDCCSYWRQSVGPGICVGVALQDHAHGDVANADRLRERLGSWTAGCAGAQRKQRAAWLGCCRSARSAVLAAYADRGGAQTDPSAHRSDCAFGRAPARRA